MNYFKTTKEGEANMTSVIEMYAKNQAEKVAAKVAEETAHQSNVEIAKNLLAEWMSEDFIVRTTFLKKRCVRWRLSRARKSSRLAYLFLLS